MATKVIASVDLMLLWYSAAVMPLGMAVRVRPFTGSATLKLYGSSTSIGSLYQGLLM